MLTTTAGAIECAGIAYSGSMPEKVMSEIELTPSYAGCTMGGVPVTVDVNGCAFRFTVTRIASGIREGSMDVVCPESNRSHSQRWRGGTLKCTIHLPQQLGKNTMTFTTVGAGATRELTIDVSADALTYTHTAGIGAGSCATGGASNGTLLGAVLVTGASGGSHVGVFSS